MPSALESATPMRRVPTSRPSQGWGTAAVSPFARNGFSCVPMRLLRFGQTADPSTARLQRSGRDDVLQRTSITNTALSDAYQTRCHDSYSSDKPPILRFAQSRAPGGHTIQKMLRLTREGI
jgi:hypothetical protein